MGLSNCIIDKRTHCPYCNKTQGYGDKPTPLCFQSKDLWDRPNVWEIGESITLKHGSSPLKFVPKGNDIWSGLERCQHCNKSIWALIFIDDGIITQIDIKTEDELQCGINKTHDHSWLNTYYNEDNNTFFETINCYEKDCDYELKKKIVR